MNNDTSFDINTREQKNELLLKKNEVTAIIPELNEYAPIDVKVTNDNVEYEYNNETRELRIVRTSTVDEDGKVTNTLPSNNTYKLQVTYPQDAINVIDNYTVITVPVSTYYEGYNNETVEWLENYKNCQILTSSDAFVVIDKSEIGKIPILNANDVFVNETFECNIIENRSLGDGFKDVLIVKNIDYKNETIKSMLE